MWDLLKFYINREKKNSRWQKFDYKKLGVTLYFLKSDKVEIDARVTFG